MSIELDIIDKKIEKYFDGGTFDLTPEEYALCKKTYGEVLPSANNVLYISIRIDNQEDLNYYTSLKKGATLNFDNNIFFKNPHDIPVEVVSEIRDREDHAIIQTLMSRKNKKIHSGSLGSVVIGVIPKENNVIFTSYAIASDDKTDLRFHAHVKPPKHINSLFYILTGTMKAIYIKVLPVKSLHTSINTIIDSFNSIEDLTKNSAFKQHARRLSGTTNIDADVYNKIKMDVFSKLVKNETDFKNFLLLKEGFISFNDVIKLNWVEKLFLKKLDYIVKQDSRSENTRNVIRFYYDDIDLTSTYDYDQIYSFIEKQDLYVDAVVEYLEKEPLKQESLEDFRERYSWSSPFDGRSVWIIDSLLNAHEDALRLIRNTNGLLNFKHNIDMYSDMLDDLNKEFEEMFQKRISFNDFYIKNNVMITNILNSFCRDYISKYVKYSDSTINKLFANNVYHLYPPSGIMGKAENDALKDKMRNFNHVMTFLGYVVEYSHIEKI